MKAATIAAGNWPAEPLEKASSQAGTSEGSETIPIPSPHEDDDNEEESLR